MDSKTKGKCTKCKNHYPLEKFNVCPVCDIELEITNTTTQNIDGNKNQTIQINGNNEGDIHLQQDIKTSTPTTIINRESIAPLKVNNTPIKNWWLFVAGGLGITANLVTTIGFFQKPISLTGTSANTMPNFMMFVMLISSLLLLAAILLQRQKYITLPFGRTLERGKQGNLYLTQIRGSCGLCHEPVRINTVGSKENRQTRVECTNNPDQHWWEFDRTVLNEVDVEYKEQQ